MTRTRILGAALAATALCFAAQPAHAWYWGNGFNLDDPHAVLPTYTIRLVDSPGIEIVRPEVERAADQYEAATGLTATVEPGVIADRTPADGEILVTTAVDPTSLCGRTWAGCTFPHTGVGGPRAGVVYELSAYVKINVAILGFGSDTRHVVIHEMGHAFGLQHYNLTFEGYVQVMHQSDYASSSYQSGDINGFVFERDYGA